MKLRVYPPPSMLPTVAEMSAVVEEIDPTASVCRPMLGHNDYFEIVCASEKYNACQEALLAFLRDRR